MNAHVLAEHVMEDIAGEDRVIVTIDGPAGTGKSSVGRELARRLGLQLLDTGAMYRAAALISLEAGLDPERDTDAIVAAVAREDLHFDWSTDPPEMLCSGQSVVRRIRKPDVTAIVSRISAIPELRRHMVRKQRIVASQYPRLVAEGRDQGSVVFPDADVKFYLDADPRVRARRRADQLREAGMDADEQTLLPEIIRRDELDSSRADGPLVCPHDAIRVDTTGLNFDQVAGLLEQHVRSRIGASRLG